MKLLVGLVLVSLFLFGCVSGPPAKSDFSPEFLTALSNATT